MLEMAGKELRKKIICEYLDSKNIKYNIKSNEEFKQYLEKWGPFSDDDEEYDEDLELQEWNKSFKPLKHNLDRSIFITNKRIKMY